MKAKLEFGFRGFSGTRDGTTYNYHPRLKESILRKKPVMPHQEMNDTYKTIAQNIREIQPSIYYKEDFSTYCSKLRDTIEDCKIVSWYNLYIKMLWAMQAKYPDSVNLKTITREQIYEQNLPCKTVKAAIEAGLLPMVSGYKIYNSEI
jgi:hypothetical protein